MRADLRWLALAVLLTPAPLAGQIIQTQDSLDPLMVPTRAELGSATYEALGRRDPFLPLTGTEAPESGPRFEQLHLTGIFEGAPGRSLVVLEDPAHRGYFVRQGESIGSAILLEIRESEAVFEVREYGAARREILRLERTEESP